MPEMWGRVYFSDWVAGTEKDYEMEERARAVALPSPSPSERLADDMVYIPPCTITLGPDPSDPERSPAHEVETEGYWIDRYPVTVA